MTPELRHLRCFVTLAEELSFSQAAKRLFVSQQSLSRTISALETELDVQLFERTTRAVTLTPAGEALLPEARRTLAAAQRAFDTARTSGNGASRPLRVDISSGGIETGALILRRLRRDHPDIAVEQVEIGVRRGVEQLRAGRLDIVLGGAIDLPDELGSEQIRIEPALVGMAADHPLAELDKVPVTALGELDLLLPSDEAAAEWNQFVAGFCRDAGFTPRRYPGATHGSTSAAEVVREGRCVVPTAAWTAPPEGVVFRPLDPAPLFTWSMIWRADDQANPAVDAFRQKANEIGEERQWLARPS